MVRTMQVEDVHTGGLEAAEGGVHLFKNTLSFEIYQNNGSNLSQCCHDNQLYRSEVLWMPQ